jgi:hypothetical protein
MKYAYDRKDNAWEILEENKSSVSPYALPGCLLAVFPS